MTQNMLKFSLVFLLFFYVGTTNIYGQYNESHGYEDDFDWNDDWNNGWDWIDDYEDWLNSQPGYGNYDYSTGGGVSPLNDGSSSGGSSTFFVTYNGTLLAVNETNNTRAAIWANLCQNQGASSHTVNYQSLIKNPDGCIPSMDTIITYLASFHEVQNNGSTAFVDNTYNLINKSSDEVLEKLINSFPNNYGIKGLWYNNIYPASSATTSIINNNRNTVRIAIGSRDLGESPHYNEVHPFDLWLEGKIRTHLLQTYSSVEFDNY